MKFDVDKAAYMEGAPWIEDRNGGKSLVISAVDSNEFVITFNDEAEFNVIVARMQAAYRGEDPNLSSFYPQSTHIEDVRGDSKT